jgi:hypothetical protein
VKTKSKAKTQKGKGATGKTKAKSKVLATSGRQERIVPNLVFQIEKAEVQIIALSSRFKGGSSSNLADFLQPALMRSFKVTVGPDAENIAPGKNDQPKAKRQRTDGRAGK